MKAGADFSEARLALAGLAGIKADRLSAPLLQAAGSDELFLHHLIVCHEDPELLAILEKEAEVLERRSPSPNLVQLGGRLTLALATWAGSAFKRVEKSCYEARISACNQCPFRRVPGPKQRLYQLMGSEAYCTKCGCDIRRKAWLPGEKCPDEAAGPAGRWKS